MERFRTCAIVMAGVAKQRELESRSKAITVLPPQSDQVEVGGFEGIEPGEVVSVRRDSNQMFPLRLRQQFVLAYPTPHRRAGLM